MKEEFYAHSREGKPPAEWNRLEDHLNRVAEMARDFTKEFQRAVDFLILTDSNERR